MNRIGRRTIMCMLLIAALAPIWNLLRTYGSVSGGSVDYVSR